MKIGFRGYHVSVLLRGAYGRTWKGAAMTSDIEPEEDNHSGIHIYVNVDEFVEGGYHSMGAVGVVDFGGYNPRIPYTKLLNNNSVPNGYRVKYARIIHLLLESQHQRFADWLGHKYGVPTSIFTNLEDLTEQLSSIKFGFMDEEERTAVYHLDVPSDFKGVDRETIAEFSDWLMNKIRSEQHSYVVYSSFQNFKLKKEKERRTCSLDDFVDYPDGTIITASFEDVPIEEAVFAVSEGDVVFVNASGAGERAKLGLNFVDGERIASPEFDLDSLGKIDFYKRDANDTYADRNTILSRMLNSSDILGLEDFPVDARWMFRTKESDHMEEAMKDPDFWMVYLHKKKSLDQLYATESRKQIPAVLRKLFRESIHKLGYDEMSHYIINKENETVEDSRSGLTFTFDELKSVAAD